MLRYSVCSIYRIAYEQFLDHRKRQIKLTQHRHETSRFELRVVVVAIARVSVNPRGNQHTEFVVQAKGLDRKARSSRELADADFFHTAHFLVVTLDSAT
jgi:hypothetical protein